ncbi:MAG TPA: hypothetical protein VLA66_06310 [Thermoanaerobaculia bacterium]|nr:hypothetical protein [Thermoanaerobaculia bacterium]
MSSPRIPAETARTRRKRARRFAVLLGVGRRSHPHVLRRQLGPSSWRCHPHAAPHPERGSAD